MILDRYTGQNVCLIGGGEVSYNEPFFSKAAHGAFDLYVQCNNHWLNNRFTPSVVYYNHGVPFEYWPKLLDADVTVVAHSFDPTIERIQDKNMHWFQNHTSTTLDTNAEWNTDDWLLTLRLMFSGFSPFIGTIATFHILRHPVRSLFITGMDCFKSEGVENKGGHSVKENLNAMRYLCADPRVTTDELLQRALQ